MGAHDKPAPPQPPNDPPGSGDGVPGEIIKPGDGKHK
jgi:hypothetical protein